MLKRSTLALLLSFCAVTAGAQTPKVHHVLFAVTSPDEQDWGLTIGNIRNLLLGFAPDTVEIEVVAYGGGIDMLKKSSSMATAVQGLESPHVHLVACQTVMRNMHLTPADLLPGVEFTPSGTVEVVRKQEAGWSYIKGGR